MATNQVTIKIPVNTITKISAQHSFSLEKGLKRVLSDSIKSDDANESKTASSELKIPLAALPTTAIVTAMQIPLTCSVSNDASGVAGASFAIVIESTQYGVDATGKITDANFFTHLNNYKAQHGTFPNLTFRVGSWIYRHYNANTTSSITITLRSPVITCNISGGQNILRPCADGASVQHIIPSGFSSVSQLISETVSDNDATYIYSYGGYDLTAGTNTSETRTSTVRIGKFFPPHTHLCQLRFYASVCFYSLDNGKLGSNGSGAINFTLQAGNNYSLTLTQKTTSIMDTASTEEAYWKKDEYYLFESIITNESDFIKNINNYYKTYGNSLEMNIDLTTKAVGYYSGGDTINYEDVTIKISQVYLEGIFEEEEKLPIHQKNGISWDNVYVLLQKKDDIWQPISLDNYQSLFEDKLVLKSWALPKGYRQLKYIESTGTQYINTGILWDTHNLRISGEYSYNQMMGHSSILGTQGGLGNFILREESGNLTWWMGKANNCIIGSVSAGQKIKFNLETYQIGLYSYNIDINNNTKYGRGTYTIAYDNNPIYLFDTQISGGRGSHAASTITCKAKLYSLKIRKNNALVRDYIPCMNPSGEIGLFDKVTNTFSPNNGTGTFISGGFVEAS